MTRGLALPMSAEPPFLCMSVEEDPGVCCKPTRIDVDGVAYCREPAPYVVLYAFPRSDRLVEHLRCVEHAAEERLPPRNLDGTPADHAVVQLRTVTGCVALSRPVTVPRDAVLHTRSQASAPVKRTRLP